MKTARVPEKNHSGCRRKPPISKLKKDWKSVLSAQWQQVLSIALV
ncbi:MAG: hypothetical protein V8R80_01250 [Eubacterium sp.]